MKFIAPSQIILSEKLPKIHCFSSILSYTLIGQAGSFCNKCLINPLLLEYVLELPIGKLEILFKYKERLLFPPEVPW